MRAGDSDNAKSQRTSHDASSQRSRETAKPASTVGDQKGNASPGALYGCHKILRTHAKGGMGKISIALDRHLKREVALKELFFEAKGSTIATLLVSTFAILIVLGTTGMLIERARSKTVAATMLADEMQKRAEEALKLAAEKEK